MAYLFWAAVAVGFVGIVFFVRGAHSLSEKQFKVMSNHHLWGVGLLTVSAALTFADVGDVTFLVMQIPFIAGSVQAWVEKHPEETSGTPIDGMFQWWNFPWAVGTNIALITALLYFGFVGRLEVLAQVIGAGSVSSGLARSAERPVFKLWLLFLGRVTLCLSSSLKFAMTPDNAAALVWACVMLYGAWGTFRALKNTFTYAKA